MISQTYIAARFNTTGCCIKVIFLEKKEKEREVEPGPKERTRNIMGDEQADRSITQVNPLAGARGTASSSSRTSALCHEECYGFVFQITQLVVYLSIASIWERYD